LEEELEEEIREKMREKMEMDHQVVHVMVPKMEKKMTKAKFDARKKIKKSQAEEKELMQMNSIGLQKYRLEISTQDESRAIMIKKNKKRPCVIGRAEEKVGCIGWGSDTSDSRSGIGSSVLSRHHFDTFLT
jgi:hypothetical protein